jgi:hypothetical protein
MKRFSVFGLCIVAAFAFSALVASSAFAKKETGELHVISSGGPAHLGTPKATITSSSNLGEGHLKSGTGGTATSNFFGVEVESTGLKCQSAGNPKGEVSTFKLTEGTGWIKKASPEEAGVDFKAASGELLAEFACEGGIEAKVRGSVIGHVTPLNVPGISQELNLIPEGIGKTNSPEQFEGGSPDVLESELNSAPGVWSDSVQVQEHVTVKNHGNASVCKVKKGVESCKPATNGEFNTHYSSVPEFGRCVKGGAKEFTDADCTHRPVGKEKAKYHFEPA